MPESKSAPSFPTKFLTTWLALSLVDVIKIGYKQEKKILPFFFFSMGTEMNFSTTEVKKRM